MTLWPQPGVSSTSVASDADSVIMEGIFVLEVDAFVLLVNNDSRVTRRLIVGALDLELDMRWELLIACAETLDIHGVWSQPSNKKRK